MKAAPSIPPGRPRTSALSRREQLRQAKRAQRERERAAGMTVVPLKLAARDATRLRGALARPDFVRELLRLLDERVVDTAAFENLAALCWNRHERYLDAAEAFRLYERNWRLVDERRMQPAERALIKRLTTRYGNGVLNV